MEAGHVGLTGGLLGLEPGAAAPFDLVCEPGGLFARHDFAAFTARERCFGLVDGCKDLRTPAFASFPERQGFLQSVFLTGKAPGLNAFPDKHLLIVSEVYLHYSMPLSFQVKGNIAPCHGFLKGPGAPVAPARARLVKPEHPA